MLDGHELEGAIDAEREADDERAGHAQQVKHHVSAPVRMTFASRAARMPT